ncbi:hypothetical protein BURK1_00231 [Burkholderiales bacterium]|nr:hypothetical protein BURK1_00231 [Burkholderiales bacterium]
MRGSVSFGGRWRTVHIATGFTESIVEQAALAWFECAGWQVRSGAEIAHGKSAARRDDYGQVVLARRLRDALARLDPALPAEALEDAFGNPGSLAQRTDWPGANDQWAQPDGRCAVSPGHYPRKPESDTVQPPMQLANSRAVN